MRFRHPRKGRLIHAEVWRSSRSPCGFYYDEFNAEYVSQTRAEVTCPHCVIAIHKAGTPEQAKADYARMIANQAKP